MKTSGLLVAVLVALTMVFSGQTTIRSQSVGAVDGAELTTASAQQAKLVASDGAPNDSFGASVALIGDTAFVAATGAGSSGAVYVFRRNVTSWTQV